MGVCGSKNNVIEEEKQKKKFEKVVVNDQE